MILRSLSVRWMDKILTFKYFLIIFKKYFSPPNGLSARLFQVLRKALKLAILPETSALVM